MRDATAPTLTSVLGSAASGSSAGNFEVTFASAVGAPTVAINATTGMITYTDNFTGGISRAQFVSTWNASAAGALFVAAPGSAATDFDTFPEITTTTATGEVLGSYDATLVTTFDQAVYGATTVLAPVATVNNNSSIGTTTTTELLGAGSVVTPAAVVAANGVTTVTQAWTNQTTAVPTAFATARYAAGAVTNLGNGQASIALTMSLITVN